VSDKPSTFGELLVEHRRAAGLTQEGLAEASGMSVRALRDLERGRAQAAQRRSAEMLADGLGLGGDEREVFLTAARNGRRKATRPPLVTGASMLPPGLPDLVGREREVARLLEAAADGGTVAVVGHPGVGKTALAVAVAHLLRPEFPDGSLAVDLRGMDDQPVTPRVALDRLLRGLGVATADIPASEAGQVDLYRAVLDGRRVLVLLDNAADEAQVRPLLAPAPECLTMVTCRRALAGLEGARWQPLGPLADGDAIELLATIAGQDRVLAEPDVAAELVALCGNLPLAVRIAGNRLATRPHWTLAHLLGRLRDERTRLSSLSVGDLQVRSAFEMSYRRLSPGARVVFRRLAAVPGADFGVELAGIATELAGPDMRAHLDELADASLLQASPVEGRFQFHDLIRLFATERWEAEETPAEREKLTRAVLDHLLGTATAAGLAFYPDATRPDGFASVDEAGEWLAREESNWLAALHAAARRGRRRELVDLVTAMHWYSDTHWMGLPWGEIFQLGVTAARALGDRPVEAKLLNFVGWAQLTLDAHASAAVATHEQALAVAIEAGDRLEQTWAHAYIATALRSLDRQEEALDHARRAVALSEEFDFWTVRISVGNRLARVLHTMGRNEEALSVRGALIAEAAERDGGVTSKTRLMSITVLRTGVGASLFAMGEWRLAAATFGEARQAFVDVGSTGSAADAALDEGDAWLEAGEHALARECVEYAIEAYGDLGPRHRRARALDMLARLPEE
jgi:transcriptional regulator with XRE-family HTH domain/tetratricopeptide (TPR) repeat protein